MSSLKRSAASTSSTSKKAKRQVTIATFKKWQTQYEREYQSLSWLRCDVDKHNREVVDLLWCDACRKHERSIVGMKNFSGAWIAGSSNHKTSNIVDHATSEQHKAVMICVRAEAAKTANQPVTTYSPIVRSLLTLDEVAKDRLK